MSNIFDALGKRGGGEPEGPREESHPGFVPQTQTTLGEDREINFQLARELEGLRERIELELPRTGRRVFGVSSSVTGEGATTVGLSLARIIARSSGVPVLLIDGDLTRSGKTLSTEATGLDQPSLGLVELIVGSVELSRAVMATEEPNLHFLPSGAQPARPIEVVSSDRMRQFVVDMGEVYRYVIIDCPSILEHPEAPVLGALTEGILLVVRAHRTRREVVQKALSQLQAARCPVLGVVLNQRRYPIPEFLYRRL